MVNLSSLSQPLSDLGVGTCSLSLGAAPSSPAKHGVNVRHVLGADVARREGVAPIRGEISGNALVREDRAMQGLETRVAVAPSLRKASSAEG